MKRSVRPAVAGSVAIVVSTFIFVVPFAFTLVTAMKDKPDSATLAFTWPKRFVLFQNIQEVIAARDFMLIRAFVNSVVITAASVAAMVVLASMAAYVLQRRSSRWNAAVNALVLAGLIVPPAVVPTIWVLQELHLFKTLPGIIFIEIAYGLPFCVLLFRAFIATVPVDLDQAAMIDGAGPLRIFFRIIFPILKSVIVTVVVLQTVFVYNDFANPLYFLPGSDHPTVQLTLFNFQSQYYTSFNLLFTDILLVTIPPLLMFAIFNRKIVEGMAAGAIKG